MSEALPLTTAKTTALAQVANDCVRWLPANPDRRYIRITTGLFVGLYLADRQVDVRADCFAGLTGSDWVGLRYGDLGDLITGELWILAGSTWNAGDVLVSEVTLLHRGE